MSINIAMLPLYWWQLHVYCKNRRHKRSDDQSEYSAISGSSITTVKDDVKR